MQIITEDICSESGKKRLSCVFDFIVKSLNSNDLKEIDQVLFTLGNLTVEDYSLCRVFCETGNLVARLSKICAETKLPKQIV